ncbi:molybdopterin-dependent oxidoreductase [Segeticoccus rhizosphaerae]|uniref:molybdopterin-dependent oxidoreductase n=1 Tax=Segeticoccus rhizosphaerae TaxID=1104777 RepID=UPI001EE4A862|nr:MULTISPECIES: molybdopterin-dependent oxidoreductase [Intrasporangiaceae]
MTDGRAPHTSAELAEPRVMPPGQRRSPQLRPVHYGRVPRVNLSTWRLSIGGLTASGEVTALDWDQVTALPRLEVLADHHCVARYTTQDVRWSGVSARALVDLCPPADGAEFVQLWATYGYSSTVRLEDLLSARAVFATHLDGEPLTPEHGWPMRVVLPHLYGFKGPKWVAAMDYHREPVRGFWEQRGYHVTGDVWREERYAHQE